MGLDKVIAARLAGHRLEEWRRLGYGEWHAMLDDQEVRQVIGEDGKRYSVVSYALDDGGGRIGMSVAADDGAWSAFVPLLRGEILNPNGTFVA